MYIHNLLVVFGIDNEAPCTYYILLVRNYCAGVLKRFTIRYLTTFTSYFLSAWDVINKKRGTEKHIIITLWFDLNFLIVPQPISWQIKLMGWWPSRLAVYSLVGWEIYIFSLPVEWHSHSKCSNTSILLNKMFLMSDVTEGVFGS